MREGIDYAWGRPRPSALKGAGKTFVCRYVSTPGNSKNINATEAKSLRKAGIDIVIVFETAASRALSGFSVGDQDAISAEQQITAAGGPSDSPVYFAVDFDASEAEQGKINDYLLGAASVIGWHRVGVYGGYWVVKRALDKNICKYAWQTYAWSGGRWDPRAQLQQYHNGARIDGVSCDLDRATQADFGQWDYRPPAPTPIRKKRKPLPGPLKKPGWFWDALKEWNRRRQKV